LEGIHVNDCDETGVKRRTTFTAGFNSRYDADAFEHWVTYKDGQNVVEPLMEADHQYCGMKVRDDTRVYPLYGCDDGDGSEASDSGATSAGSDDSPRVISSDGTHYMDNPYTGQSYRATVGIPVDVPPTKSPAAEQRSADIGVATGPADLQPSTPSSDPCRRRYQVDWELRMLPGSIGEDNSDRSRELWSREADTHFYLRTSSLVRQIMSDHMPGLAGQPNSLDIRLAEASHSKGRIDDSGCGRGVMKHVLYRFLFDDHEAALHFSEWLGADSSRFVTDWLKRADPQGICGSEGEIEAGPTPTWWCADSGVSQGGMKFVFGQN
jgi:hypothetical protein